MDCIINFFFNRIYTDTFAFGVAYPDLLGTSIFIRIIGAALTHIFFFGLIFELVMLSV